MHARVASRSLPCRVVASYACGRIIKYGLLFLCEDHIRSSKERKADVDDEAGEVFLCLMHIVDYWTLRPGRAGRCQTMRGASCSCVVVLLPIIFHACCQTKTYSKI
jgi:hypothetical protein